MITAKRFGTWVIPKTGRQEVLGARFREASQESIRGSGSINLWGTGKAPIQDDTHEVPFLLKGCTPQEYESLIAQVARAQDQGLEQLWFAPMSVGGVSDQRFTLAYITEIEEEIYSNNWSWGSLNVIFKLNDPQLYKPLGVGYLTTNGYSAVEVPEEEFGEAALLWPQRFFAYWDVSASPTTLVITNEGHRTSQKLIIRIESLGADGAINPKVENLTTGQFIQYNGTLTTDQVFQANAAIGPSAVRISDDAGASFVDLDYDATNVWPSCSVADTQNPIMELAYGENQIQIIADGSPNFRVMFLWQPAYLRV